MKEAVSVSLGSKSRDHSGVIDFGDEKVKIRREGTDGDSKAMAARYKELDGTVDAFGAGGCMFNFEVAGKVWPVKTVSKIIKGIEKTPIVDGTGVKNTIERNIMTMIASELDELMERKPKTAMISTGLDRYAMAKSILDAGYDLIYGDLAFGLGINIKIKTEKSLKRLARLSLPIVSRMPLQWLYPTGSKQDSFTPKYGKFFKDATIIAGDFLYTKKYAPYDMEGKIILTNTTTASDIEEFKKRGVSAIITTTPDVGGRSFGTNGLEAAIVAYAGLGRPLTHEEMSGYIEKLGIKPQIIRFDQ